MSEGFGLTHYLPFVLRRASELKAGKLRLLQREAGIHNRWAGRLLHYFDVRPSNRTIDPFMELWERNQTPQ